MDFPREGNGNSFAHARRQFNLVDDELLRYKFLNEFDVAMNWLEEKYQWLSAPQVSVAGGRSTDVQAYVSLKNESDKVIVFERAGLLFVFNFNPTQSFTDYRVGVETAGKYKVVLSSDESRFGGHDRIDLNGEFLTTPMEWNGRKNFLQVYTPCRTVLVLGLE